MMTKKYFRNKSKTKFLLIILGAVIFSTAPFWHVAFKDNTVKTLVKEYHVLKNDAIDAKIALMDLALRSERSNSDLSVFQKEIIAAANNLKAKHAITDAAFENYEKIKKENDFFFFKDKEQFVSYLGIAVFLFYAAFSMFSFYYNRKSENKDYLQAVKIKSILLLGGATFYAAYILYPSGGDFNGGVYWYISCMTALIAIAFSFTFIRYVVDLEEQVLSFKGNLGRAFQYITTLKQKLLPIADQALETARSERQKATIVNELYDLEDKDKEFYNSIDDDESRELFGVTLMEHLYIKGRKKDTQIDILCEAHAIGKSINDKELRKQLMDLGVQERRLDQ